MARSIQMMRAIKDAKEAARAPKSELMRILRKLEENGAIADAKKLDRLIGQLEAWQAS